jgi:beta-glucosidase
LKTNACLAGCRSRGYFHWSLMDNLEVYAGFQPKFGLYLVDLATQQRIPKLSAQSFRAVARQYAAV